MKVYQDKIDLLSKKVAEREAQQLSSAKASLSALLDKLNALNADYDKMIDVYNYMNQKLPSGEIKRILGSMAIMNDKQSNSDFKKGIYTINNNTYVAIKLSNSDEIPRKYIIYDHNKWLIKCEYGDYNFTMNKGIPIDCVIDNGDFYRVSNGASKDEIVFSIDDSTYNLQLSTDRFEKYLQSAVDLAGKFSTIFWETLDFELFKLD